MKSDNKSAAAVACICLVLVAVLLDDVASCPAAQDFLPCKKAFDNPTTNRPPPANCCIMIKRTTHECLCQLQQNVPSVSKGSAQFLYKNYSESFAANRRGGANDENHRLTAVSIILLAENRKFNMARARKMVKAARIRMNPTANGGSYRANGGGNSKDDGVIGYGRHTNRVDRRLDAGTPGDDGGDRQ
ncbi:lipid-transfer protein [Striga asiatica]|uniref:Lipid-transfer protein n=1 Tax=Striga asiatica TaxID=4170 RepID=A0A5A7PIU8_STRAF|nr:lipid-transfer protein [Striga asiatica]